MSLYRKKIVLVRWFVTFYKILLSCFGPATCIELVLAMQVYFFSGQILRQPRDREREFHFNQQCKIEI